MNGLLVSIVWVIILYTSGIFGTNYFILDLFKSSKYSPVLIYCVILSLYTFIIGLLIALYSSKKNCNRVDKLNLIKQGLRHVIFFLGGYMLIYYVSFIREPFLTIFGSDKLGYSIAQSFMIVLNSITATIINYYTSIEKSCKVSQTDIDKNLKKLDNYLDKKPEKKYEKKIEVRD
jgi:hypothetical protein